jgi:bacterioferritin (cytochrome b1)
MFALYKESSMSNLPQSGSSNPIGLDALGIGTVVMALNPRAIEAGETRSDPVDDESIRQLNTFLRGEISASETYRMAIDKLIEDEIDPARVSELRQLQAEHIKAAEQIRRRIVQSGGKPVDSSGPWGAWAKFAVGTAEIFGDTATLRAIKDGEAHGLKEFNDGLVHLNTESAELIRNHLIPAQESHIEMLAQLIEIVGA